METELSIGRTATSSTRLEEWVFTIKSLGVDWLVPEQQTNPLSAILSP